MLEIAIPESPQTLKTTLTVVSEIKYSYALMTAMVLVSCQKRQPKLRRIIHHLFLLSTFEAKAELFGKHSDQPVPSVTAVSDNFPNFINKIEQVRKTLLNLMTDKSSGLAGIRPLLYEKCAP